MLPLRYPRLWMMPGWLLVAGVVLGSVIPDTPLRVFEFSDKFQHALSYGLLMLRFAGLYSRNRYPWIALSVLLLGVVLEIVQSRLPYRTFDPLDILADAGGVLVGFGLSFWLLAGWCMQIERLLASRNARD